MGAISLPDEGNGMKHEIALNDVSESLIASPDPAYCDDLNLTCPAGTSGKFIEWEQAGKLEEFASVCVEAQRMVRERSEIENKLRSCNCVASLIELKATKKKHFVKGLKARVHKLEYRKLEIENRLLVIKLFLKMEAPELVRFTEQVDPELSFPTSIRRGTRESSPYVAIRTATIQKYPDKSHEEICRILDRELSSRELPERWITEFEVESFWQAYRNPKVRPLVHTMISKARRLTRSPKIRDN
jgi:hypothetical protein